MADSLLVEQKGRVVTLTNNDAPYNRMSPEFIDELERLIPKLGKDDTVGAIVIRGAGEEHFSVGMDLKRFGDAVKAHGSFEGVLDQRLRVIAQIERMSKPWIATLYGFCLGGGLELPLGCHFRLAAEEDAKIGLPEMDLGSVPAWGGSARLVRCVGRDHALDMILRAKKISGPEALRIGLVQEVWPNDELQARAADLGRELASQPSIAVAGMLEAIVGCGDLSLEEGIAAERRAVRMNSGTPDNKEGMQAFLEKRPPVFHREDSES